MIDSSRAGPIQARQHSVAERVEVERPSACTDKHDLPERVFVSRVLRRVSVEIACFHIRAGEIVDAVNKSRSKGSNCWCRFKEPMWEPPLRFSPRTILLTLMCRRGSLVSSSERRDRKSKR